MPNYRRIVLNPSEVRQIQGCLRSIRGSGAYVATLLNKENPGTLEVAVNSGGRVQANVERIREVLNKRWVNPRSKGKRGRA